VPALIAAGSSTAKSKTSANRSVTLNANATARASLICCSDTPATNTLRIAYSGESDHLFRGGVFDHPTVVGSLLTQGAAGAYLAWIRCNEIERNWGRPRL